MILNHPTKIDPEDKKLRQRKQAGMHSFCSLFKYFLYFFTFK